MQPRSNKMTNIHLLLVLIIVGIIPTIIGQQVSTPMMAMPATPVSIMPSTADMTTDMTNMMTTYPTPSMDQMMTTYPTPSMDQMMTTYPTPSMDQMMTTYPTPSMDQMMTTYPTPMDQMMTTYLTPSMDQMMTTYMTPSIDQMMTTYMTPSMDQTMTMFITPSMDQTMTTFMTPFMDQTTYTNNSMDQTITTNMTPSMDQMMTTTLTDSTDQTMTTYLTPSMDQTMITNMTDSMDQTMITNMTDSMDQTMITNMTDSMDQTMITNMTPSMDQTMTTYMTPLMDQTMTYTTASVDPTMSTMVYISEATTQTSTSDAFPGAFQCFPNRTIIFANPNATIYTHFTAFYDMGGLKQNCSGFASANNENIIFDCASATATVTAYFSDHSLDMGILANDALSYTFVCQELSNYNETISRGVDVSINQTDETAIPTYNITAGFRNSTMKEITSAKVGDKVVFYIQAPAEFELVPLQCNATGSGGDYITLISNGCANHASLMSSFVVSPAGVDTYYFSALNVFMFYTSESLTITCNVQVCVEGGCPFHCEDDERLEKRQVRGTDTKGNDDLRTATVGKSLRIVQIGLGGSYQARGSVVLVMMLAMIVGRLGMQ